MHSFRAIILGCGVTMSLATSLVVQPSTCIRDRRRAGGFLGLEWRPGAAGTCSNHSAKEKCREQR